MTAKEAKCINCLKDCEECDIYIEMENRHTSYNNIPYIPDDDGEIPEDWGSNQID